MCYCAYLSYSKNNTSQLWGLISIIIFTLVFGLRYGVGVDYYSYANVYEYAEKYTSLADLIEGLLFEVGFSAIVFYCNFFHLPVYVFFSILAFIQITLIYKTFKPEGNNLLVFIYLTLILTGFCMYSFMNIIRHEIALCFFLYGIKYIRDNKPTKYFITCLFAFAFHKSALLIFPLYFFWIHKKSIFNNSIIQITILLACFAVSFIVPFQTILAYVDQFAVMIGYDKYSDIADSMTVNRVLGISRIMGLFTNIFIIAYNQKIKSYFKSDLFNIIYDLYFVGTCLGYAFMGSMMLLRAIVYFQHTQFIVLAYALCYLYNTRKQTYTQLSLYFFFVVYIMVSYVSFIKDCKNNTGAYVGYFQKELHSEKDLLFYDRHN